MPTERIICPGSEVRVIFGGKIVTASIQRIGVQSSRFVMLTLSLPNGEIGYIAELADRVYAERAHGS